MRPTWRELRRKLQRRVMGSFDEIWHPSGQIGAAAWEAHVEAPAPAPSPGDTDLDNGRIVIRPPER